MHRIPGGQNGANLWLSFFPQLWNFLVGVCPSCLKNAGDALGLLVCAFKGLEVWSSLTNSRTVALKAKMGQILDRLIFTKFEAPWAGDLPYMLETYWEGPMPISLHVERTKKFDQVLPLRPLRPTMDQFFARLFPQILIPFSRGPVLHALICREGPRSIIICFDRT